jgi:hypothetical protein
VNAASRVAQLTHEREFFDRQYIEDKKNVTEGPLTSGLVKIVKLLNERGNEFVLQYENLQ